MKATQLLTQGQKEYISAKLEAYLLEVVDCGQQVRPLILQTTTETVLILAAGPAGKWLRRYLKKQRVMTAAKGGSVGMGGPTEHCGLIGGRPQIG